MIYIRLLVALGISCTFSLSVLSQDLPDNDEHKSIHRLQLENPPSQTTPDIFFPNSAAIKSGITVFGYHPYWAQEAYRRYDYSVLTHLGFFAFIVDTADGSPKQLYGWGSGNPVIALAHEKGVKVVLVAVNFGGAENRAILSDSSKSASLVDNLIYQLDLGKGDGINIDFEAIPSDQKQNFVRFIRMLRAKMKTFDEEWELSIASPAVDWSGAWDFAALNELVDYFIMMGYDYYYSGSPNAGPVAPMLGGNYNVTKSIGTYLSAGVEVNKLVLGVPWYGYRWATQDSSKQSKTLGTGSAKIFDTMEALAAQHGKRYDDTYKSAWIKYKENNVWYEAWYDDSISLAYKYAYVEDAYLKGIAIWALNYNPLTNTLWKGIAQAFGDGTSTEENNIDIINVFPNPAKDEIEIQTKSSAIGAIFIRDLNGSKLLSAHLSSSPEKLNIKDLSNGVYFITDSNGNLLGKFLKE